MTRDSQELVPGSEGDTETEPSQPPSFELSSAVAGVVPDDTFTVDQAVDALGFGKFQVSCLFIFLLMRFKSLCPSELFQRDRDVMAPSLSTRPWMRWASASFRCAIEIKKNIEIFGNVLDRSLKQGELFSLLNFKDIFKRVISTRSRCYGTFMLNMEEIFYPNLKIYEIFFSIGYPLQEDNKSRKKNYWRRNLHRTHNIRNLVFLIELKCS